MYSYPAEYIYLHVEPPFDLRTRGFHTFLSRLMNLCISLIRLLYAFSYPLSISSSCPPGMLLLPSFDGGRQHTPQEDHKAAKQDRG